MRNKGISLIVLIITIIVMIIIAGAIIMTISDTGIIDKANEAVEESNQSEVESAANLALADILLVPENRTKTDEELTELIVDKLGNDAKDFTVKYENGKVILTKKVDLSASDSFIYTIEVKEDNTEVQLLANVPAEVLNGLFNSFAEGRPTDNPVPEWENVDEISYNFTIDFGDSTSATCTSAGEGMNHTYQTAGTYTVKITGTSELIYITTISNDNYDLLSIESWGNVSAKYIGIERSNDNLGTNALDIVKPKATSFEDLIFFMLDAGSLGVSSIPNGFFKGCNNLKYVANAFSNSSNVSTIPADLFEGCTNLKSGFYLFVDSNNITQIPEDLFKDCNNLKYLVRAFEYCEGLTSIPTNLLTVERNPHMYSFLDSFHSASSITGLAPEYWNIYSSNSPIGTRCFNEVDVTNISSIPDGWK